MRVIKSALCLEAFLPLVRLASSTTAFLPHARAPSRGSILTSSDAHKMRSSLSNAAAVLSSRRQVAECSARKKVPTCILTFFLKKSGSWLLVQVIQHQTVLERFSNVNRCTSLSVAHFTLSFCSVLDIFGIFSLCFCFCRCSPLHMSISMYLQLHLQQSPYIHRERHTHRQKHLEKPERERCAE